MIMKKKAELSSIATLFRQQAPPPKRSVKKRLTPLEKVEEVKRKYMAKHGLIDEDLPSKCPKCKHEPDWSVVGDGIVCGQCGETTTWEEVVPLVDRREAMKL